jgi:hypothetical protein
MGIEQRLRALETAIIRLNVTFDRMIELQYSQIQQQRVVVPHGKNLKKHSPKKLTRDRVIAMAGRYERVKSEQDLDILLKVFEVERVVDLPKEDYARFYKQMLSELHTSIEET